MGLNRQGASTAASAVESAFSHHADDEVLDRLVVSYSDADHIDELEKQPTSNSIDSVGKIVKNVDA